MPTFCIPRSMCYVVWGAVEPEDCFLNNSRVLTIATAFGFAIFVTVFMAASFSGALMYMLDFGVTGDSQSPKLAIESFRS